MAFEKADEVGVDGIELDIQFTKDHEIVIIHDSTVNRTTNGKGYVKDLTLNEVRELNAAQGYAGTTEKIPTLKEYLSWVRDKDLVTNIELKTNIFEYPGIEQKALDLVKTHNLEEKIIFSSFNHYSIQRVKALAPEIKCGLLCSDWIVDFGKYVAALNVECVHPAFYMLQNNNVLQDFFDHDLEINTWTVNDEDHMKQLIDDGVTSIITNFPEKLKTVLAAKSY